MSLRRLAGWTAIASGIAGIVITMVLQWLLASGRLSFDPD